MDKKSINSQIVVDVLSEFAGHRKALLTDIQTVFLKDKEQGHFQLLSYGWYEDEFVHFLKFHCQVSEDGTVRILANHTDEPIDDYLMQKGVQEQDIQVVFREKPSVYVNSQVA